MGKKLILMLVLFVLVLSSTVKGDMVRESILIVFFGAPSCPHCQNVAAYLDYIEEANGLDVSVKRYDLTDRLGKQLYDQYVKVYQVNQQNIGVIPIIFISDTYLIRERSIIDGLEPIIAAIVSGQRTYEPKEIDEMHVPIEFSESKRVTIAAMAVGGLLDGLNPCALSMLILFLSLLNGKHGKRIILTLGLSFLMGSFLTYFVLGLAISRFLSLTVLYSSFMPFLYAMMFIFCITLSVLNAADWIRTRSGTTPTRLVLPPSFRHFGHRLLRMTAQSRLALGASFLAGSIMTFVEFACSGQVYVPTITHLLSVKETAIQGITYLLVYNIAFVLPMLVVVIAAIMSKNLASLAKRLPASIPMVRAAAAVFYALMAYVTLRDLARLL